MKKIILTKGLPASGKTTWAKSLIANEPGKWKRINKDDLRAMVDGGKWSKDNEKFILIARDALIAAALVDHNIIVDDTNLHPKHYAHIVEFAKGKADVEIKDFTDVPLELCLQRDKLRLNAVGEKVIKQMYNQYVRKIPIVINDPKLSGAILCDIDGTLAHFAGASPYDRDFSQDTVDETVRNILWRYTDMKIPIILVSGRMEKNREVTETWLIKNLIHHTALFMRPTDDIRNDTIVKQEIYEREIKGKYNVLFVLDDRDRVVRMWRDQGLKCLQVAEGDF